MELFQPKLQTPKGRSVVFCLLSPLLVAMMGPPSSFSVVEALRRPVSSSNNNPTLPHHPEKGINSRLEDMIQLKDMSHQEQYTTTTTTPVSLSVSPALQNMILQVIPRAGGIAAKKKDANSSLFQLEHYLRPLPEHPSSYDERCNARANFVKFMLHARLEYVRRGQRARDFCQWVRRNRGETAAIVSDQDEDTLVVHAEEEDGAGGLLTAVAATSSSNITGNTTATTATTTTPHTTLLASAISNPAVAPELEKAVIARLKHDPFAADRMNLDLVLTSRNPSECFDESSGSGVQNRPPTRWQLLGRAVQLGVHFMPVWSTTPLALLSKAFRERVWYHWVASALGSSGAAFIKWGQWSSTRNDMFPDALCSALSQLHASAPEHSAQYSQQQIGQALGLGRGTLGCVLDEFDGAPIASGSIAQIHRANLCGVDVAVKVRHPNVQWLMDLDFRLMTMAATIADKIPALQWLHIRESVEQFSHTMAAQAYLQVEAHHLEVLNYNFRNWPRVKFPTPFFASAAVIIETFEEGVISTDIIDRYDRIAAEWNSHNNQRESSSGSGSGEVQVQEVDEDDTDTESKKEPMSANISTSDTQPERIEGHELMPLELSKFLVSTGVSMYLKMLLVDGLMHADLHPGNIMVDCRHRRKHQFTKSSSVTTNNKNKKEEKALALVGGSSQQQQEELATEEDAMLAMDDIMEHIKITLVDAGMVTKLNDQESSAFIGLMASLGEGNGAEAAQYALQFSVDTDIPEERRRAFAADMVELFKERCRGYGTDVDVGYVLRGILGLIRQHRVRIDANFATLVINALCIESLARRVCPSYNVLDAAKPLLRGYRQSYLRNHGSAKSSRLFNIRMAANALKKEIDDRIFFGREAKRKLERQQKIAKLVQSVEF